MAARMLIRALRSLTPNSSFVINHPAPPRIPISAFPSSSSSSLIHKSTPSSPTFFTTTALRLFTSQPHYEPKAITLTIIIHELAEAGRTKEALHVYKRFKVAGIFPEYYTHDALIMALAADPQLVAEAKECVVDMMTNQLCYHPSVDAYMTVYKGFVKQNKAEEGLRFLKEIKAKGLCGVDEESVKEALEGTSEDEVKRVIDILMDDKYGESTRPFHSLYKSYATMAAYFKKYTHAELCRNEDFMQNIKTAHAFVMNCAADSMFGGLIQDGLNEEAMEFRASILETGKLPPVVFFTGWISSIDLVPGSTKEAIEVFQQMISVGTVPNAYTYDVLIKVLVKDPEFISDAKKYLLEMVNKGMRPNGKTYKSVVEAFAAEERIVECVELMKQMKVKGIELQ